MSGVRSGSALLLCAVLPCAIGCHRCDDAPGAATSHLAAQHGEAPTIRHATLELRETSSDVAGQQVVFLDDDGERWAVSSTEELRILEGRALQTTVSLPRQPAAHDLVLRSDGQALLVGAVEVSLSHAPSVHDLPVKTEMRPCFGVQRELALPSRDGRVVAAILRDLPSPCSMPVEGRQAPPQRPDELQIVDRDSGDIVARQDMESNARVGRSLSFIAVTKMNRVEILASDDLERLASIPQVRGHAQALAFSPDEAVLVVLRSDGQIIVIECEHWTIVDRWNAGTEGGVIAFHPRFPVLAVAGRDRSLRLWDLSHQPPRELVTASVGSSEAASPTDIVFSPDGTRLAVARGHGGVVAHAELRIDADRRSLERPYTVVHDHLRRDSRGRPLPWGAAARLGEPGEGESRGVAALAFTEDGLLSVDRAGRMSRWPDRSPRVIDDADYEHLAIAPDGSFVARAGRESSRIEIVDARSNEVLQTIVLDQLVQALRAGPELIAVGTYGFAGLFRSNGEEVRRHTHTTTVTVVAISSDGRRFASCDVDNVSLVSDLSSSAAPVRIVDRDSARDAWFSSTGEELAVAHYRSNVHLWNARAGGRFSAVETGLDSMDHVALSPDDRWLVAAGHDVVILDRNGDRTHRLRPILSPDVLAFDVDRGRLATASRYGGVALWDLASGRALPSAPGHTASVEEVRFTSDGSAVISSDRDGNLIRWDVESGEAAFLGYGSGIMGLGPVSSDPSLLVITSNYHAVLMDASSGDERWRDSRTSSALALSPDGTRLAVLRTPGGVDIMDAQVGRVMETVGGPRGDLPEVLRFRDDERLVGWGSERLYTWSRGRGWTTTPIPAARGGHVQLSADGSFGVVVSGQCARRLDTDTGDLTTCLSFEPGMGTSISTITSDGRLLAVSLGGGAAVWDVDSATLLVEPEADGQRVTALDLSPDGRFLAMGLEDRTILVMRIPENVRS